MSATPSSREPPPLSDLSSRGSRQRAVAIQLPGPNAAAAERAFLQARRTVYGHLVFIALCCLLAFVLRKLLHLPATMIGAVFAAGLVVFASDIIRMFRRRQQLKRALAQTSRL